MQIEDGPEAALPRYGKALTAYADLRRSPHTIDGFLAPGPGTRAEVIDAMERAAICSLGAGRESEGVAALGAASGERRRTGIVANDRLRTVLDEAGNLGLSVPSGHVETFDVALQRAGAAFSGQSQTP